MKDKKFSDYHNEIKKKEPKKKEIKVVDPIEESVTVNETVLPIPTQETIVIKEQIIVDKIDINTLNEGISKLVEKTENLLEERNQQNEQNKLLIETLNNLSEKIDMLDKSIKSIKNIEIPTPIVNVTMPERKVIKTPVRDDKGIITHIIEEDYKEDKKE